MTGLADRLGDEHDLAVMQESPLVQEMQGANRGHAEVFSSIVSRERSRLRRAATPLAERIYVESANRFVVRVEGYWLAYHSQGLTDPR